MMRPMDAGRFSKPISDAIAIKSGGAPSSSLLWERAADSVMAAGASESTLLAFIEAFASPRLLLRFYEAHARHGDGMDQTLAAVAGNCDELGLGRSEYLQGIETVLRYLEARGKSARPSVVVGFVFCSGEFASGQVDVESLGEVVAEMLERYGFDG